MWRPKAASPLPDQYNRDVRIAFELELDIAALVNPHERPGFRLSAPPKAESLGEDNAER